MYLTMQELGDFLPVGPQYRIASRANRAPVIMRGPHGQRLSSEPKLSVDRYGRRVFTGWLETARDKVIVPKQRVVGLLGELPPDWECPVRNRTELLREISKLETGVRSANTRPALERLRQRKEELLECHMVLGNNLRYKSHADRLRNVGNLILLKLGRIAPGTVDPDTGKSKVKKASVIEEFKRELSRRGMRDLSEIDWKKYLIYGGLSLAGFALVYGAVTTYVRAKASA